jgi:hypothetical protein
MPPSAPHRRATREIREPAHSYMAEIERVVCPCVEKWPRARDIRGMDPTLEQMADALVENGDYRVTRRLQPRTKYHPPDDIAAVVDVETTGTGSMWHA